jgi:hypothetical protein
MQATIGVHKGTSLKILVLKQPDYINWLLPYDARGPLEVMKTEVLRLIEVFDAKEIVAACSADGCKRAASRFSIYGADVTPMCWCADCDPHLLGAQRGKIQLLKTYRDCLGHVKRYCGSQRNAYIEIIKRVARVKGSGARVGEPQAAAFFSG